MNNLSLIILNYNSFLDTEKCVSKLLSFSSNFRIIIVDNHSQDCSYSYLVNRFGKDNSVDIIISDKNGGYSYGNNFGIRFAKEKYNSKIIGILNPDVILPDLSLLTDLVVFLENNNNLAMIGACPIENKQYSPNKAGWSIPNKFDVFLDRSLWLPRWKNNTLNILDENIAKVDCVVGCFFLIKESIFSELRYFDENVFLYNEENILGIKLSQKGYQAGIAYKKFYYHNHDYTKELNRNLRSKIYMLKIRFNSRKYLINKYYSFWQIPFLYVVEFLNVVKISLGHIKNKLFNR
ncbi:glycosyltransferase family 2 protein [Exercitatus varius]|uniref:Glycosyltransferase family 2 protein n=1 Tax=Exercitatus varius TaxID=67857 RepID=A0AAW6Q8X3_9PAST|nr:glycosyltransferase family 2 protein [Exercitatus varius]MDG2949975.1 glycosyltransferase family 2 protein [Exercitatus varius]